MIVENELYEYVVILIIFLFGSAFYSASETALSTVSKIRMKHLARNGDKDAAGILTKFFPQFWWAIILSI